VLHFEDGWNCIARFTRDYEMLQKTESELATIEYVRKNTTIPVPEIYFVNHNENHVVGAPFVLMERMDGGRLCDIWEDLSLEHKLDVMGQIAEVVGQLSEQKFDKIGSLTRDGTVGPMLSPTEPTQPLADHPFTSTIDYFFAYLKDDNPERSEAARKFYPEVRDELRSFFERNATNPLLHAPYRLVHDDLDYQNILVVQQDKALPTKDLRHYRLGLEPNVNSRITVLILLLDH
jgi:aminoglycoside phosphotransferase (APT) family kinase protein